MALESPLTHAEVSDELENLEIDKATVFRNLTDLVAKNVTTSISTW